MYERHIKKRVLESLQEFRVVYISGARQAGKSTLINLLSGRCGNLLSYNDLSNERGIGDEKTENTLYRYRFSLLSFRYQNTGATIGQSAFGGLLENLLFIDLCKNAVFSGSEAERYHFRDHKQKEVDIVLKEAGGMICSGQPIPDTFN